MKNNKIANEKDSVMAGDEDIRYEKCVCCKKMTKVLKKTNVELRSFYVEGAGQLCYDCYKGLYHI